MNNSKTVFDEKMDKDKEIASLKEEIEELKIRLLNATTYIQLIQRDK